MNHQQIVNEIAALNDALPRKQREVVDAHNRQISATQDKCASIGHILSAGWPGIGVCIVCGSCEMSPGKPAHISDLADAAAVRIA